ncbi:MAG: hypothetical protein ACHQU0_02625 [Candidatus Paceibacteria bacterium]
MDTQHSRAFISPVEPPRELFSAILARIALARRRSAYLQLAAFGTTTFLSVLFLIAAVEYALNEFYTSGFYDYASLFFDSLSRGYWQEILYSLADSLPSFALLFLIVTATTFVWSARHTRQNARIAFTRSAVLA